MNARKPDGFFCLSVGGIAVITEYVRAIVDRICSWEHLQCIEWEDLMVTDQLIGLKKPETERERLKSIGNDD